MSESDERTEPRRGTASHRMRHSARSASSARPSRRTVVLIAIAAVAVVGVVVAILLTRGGAAEEPAAPPAETITNPLPTPAVEPIDKGSGSAFFDLLPTSVLQFALSELAPDDGDEVAQAVEAHTLTYDDGGGTTVVVRASQWRTAAAAEEAAEAFGTAAREAEPDGEVGERPVEAGGEEVGHLTAVVGESEGRAVWTNGTAVLDVVGPAAAIEDFVRAFPI